MSHIRPHRLIDLLDTPADRLQAIGMPWDAQFVLAGTLLVIVIDRMTWPIVVGITRMAA
jgi:hypothetical protein